MNDIQTQKQLSDRDLAIFNAELDRARRSTVVAYLLWWFFGTVGAHNFYIGKIGWGFAHIILVVIGPALVVSSVLVGTESTTADAEATAFGLMVVGGLALALILILLLWDMITLPGQIRRRENQVRSDLLSRLGSGDANPFRPLE